MICSFNNFLYSDYREEEDDDDDENNDHSEEEDVLCDMRSESDRLSPNFDDDNKSRFTEYSMTSSVIRRNAQLSLLDDRFEQVCHLKNKLSVTFQIKAQVLYYS